MKDALKLTWPDDELKKRDSHKSAALFTAEESILIAEDEDMGEEESPEWETQEEAYAYQALEEDAQEAFAALQDARRTLREAREKQSQMRRNRGFYNGAPGRSGGSGSSRPPPKCFRCGGPHFRRIVPKNPAAQDPSRKSTSCS